MIINHKEARMVQDGEDLHALHLTNLKNLGSTFQSTETVT